DIVLTDMCSLIQKNIRTNDTLFRVGGEEFVILLPITSLSEAKDVADKLKTIIANDLTTIENRQITVSIGVVEVHSEDTEDSMYRRVDELLYRSKHNGKNMVTSQ
ncbi:MAG: GGDEF domain-containing protein, partial [Sulfuricurvum sp.]|nr:GGDEF domain-containing protein [Sulfuricurvum sp.]